MLLQTGRQGAGPQNCDADYPTRVATFGFPGPGQDPQGHDLTSKGESVVDPIDRRVPNRRNSYTQARVIGPSSRLPKDHPTHNMPTQPATRTGDSKNRETRIEIATVVPDTRAALADQRISYSVDEEFGYPNG